MRRVGVRLAMATVGVALLASYLAVAYLSYLGLRWLWLARPDTPTLVVGLAVGTLLAGYLSYRFGTARLLSAIDAREVGPGRAPELSARIERLAKAMGVRTPTLYVAELGPPNAMAVGGARRGAVVIDHGLPRLLNRQELDAILAHELAHLEGHDGLLQTLAYSVGRTVVAAVSLVALPPAFALSGLARGYAWLRGRPADRSDALHRLRRWLDAAVVVVPFAFTLAVRAHSRRREYAADDRAVAVTADPLALARALRKIERAAGAEWGLLGPLYVRGDEEGLLTRLLSTHPPMDERIKRLVEKAEQWRGRNPRSGSGSGRRQIPIGG